MRYSKSGSTKLDNTRVDPPTWKPQHVGDDDQVGTGSQANARHLQANKAWNWKWPDNRNRWHTSSQSKGKRPKAPGTTVRIYGKQAYYGPSKKTLAKRKAKAQRTSKGRRRMARGK